MLARLRKEEGFGLIELVMAMLMLSIGILAILAAFTSGSNAIRRANRVATASALADAQMELYRALRYNSIALAPASVSLANAIPSYSSDPAWSSSQVTTSCTTPLPLECMASQLLTGADGSSYRVDTYITYLTYHTFTATLSGAQEVPPSGSAGTGSATVVLNAAEDTITVNVSFSNLGSSANGAHIHGPALPGVNAGILFPLRGVPSSTSGTIPQQTFAINSGQVADLKNGLHYVNIHTTGFTGGEIREQLTPRSKLVTIVVRELSGSSSQTQVRVSSTFDLATG